MSNRKSFYWKCVESGVCTRCGKEKIVISRCCKKCHKRKLKSQKKYINKLVKLNLCVDCKNRNDNASALWCKVCTNKHTILNRERFKLLKNKGICGLCGKDKVVPGIGYCKKCNKKKKSYAKLRWIKLRGLVYKEYGSKCICCQESEFEFLTLDHKGNDGKMHRKELRRGGLGGSVYKWAINNRFPKTLQLLCANCHISKTRFGKCVHKRQNKGW